MKDYFLAILFLATIGEYGKTTVASTILVESSPVKADAEDNHGDEQRNLAVSLAERWSILEPTFGVEGMDFTFEYPLSTFIDQNMAYYELYDANCQEGGTLVSTESFTRSPLVDVAPGSFTDEANFSMDGKTARVEIAIDPTRITSDTDVYSETDDGPATKRATITFCVRFGLRTLGDTPIEVNFLETVIELTINLSSGFSVDEFNVSPKDKVVSTATEAYNVNGYLCEPGTDILVADATAALAQGSLITVCVRPDAEAISDGIMMRTIDSFEWTRGLIRQQAIESSIASDNLLTNFDAQECEGEEYCQLSSILFAGFYSSEGEVSGSGVASMQFGTSRRRQRRGLGQETGDKQPHRNRVLQGASEFDLSFSIRAGDDSRPELAHMYAASACAGTRLAIVGSGLVAIVALWW